MRIPPEIVLGEVSLGILPCIPPEISLGYVPSIPPEILPEIPQDILPGIPRGVLPENSSKKSSRLFLQKSQKGIPPRTPPYILVKVSLRIPAGVTSWIPTKIPP